MFVFTGTQKKKNLSGDTIFITFRPIFCMYIVVINTTLDYTTYSSMGFLNISLEFHFFKLPAFLLTLSTLENTYLL